jgi:hypothetical protein
MKIIVKNRRTGVVEFELDVNSEGNIHDLVLEQNGARFEVSGIPYGFGLEIKAAEPVKVLPSDRRTVEVST